MPGGRIPDGVGDIDLVYVVLYRLRTLTEEEKREWSAQWVDIKTHLPDGLRIVIEGYGAFGTEYTGFTVYEGPMEKFRSHIEVLDRRAAPYVEKTRTIIGTKGFNLPLAGISEVLDSRPVD